MKHSLVSQPAKIQMLGGIQLEIPIVSEYAQPLTTRDEILESLDNFSLAGMSQSEMSSEVCSCGLFTNACMFRIDFLHLKLTTN